jgi:hypothetical protein
VVGRLEREPRFVGDMPHGWISSDYIRSALDLFAYERQFDHALVIGDGIPPAWLAGEDGGVTVRKLRTPYGPLSYSMRQQGGRVSIVLDAGTTLPPGGFVLRAADRRWTGARTSVNGRPAAWRGRELRVRTLPATIHIDTLFNSKARP